MSTPNTASIDPAHLPPVVSPEWVLQNRERVVLADVRWYLDGRSGADAFRAGHVDGAVFVDMDTDLSDHRQPAVLGRHPMPSPEHFAAAMTRLGIGDTTPVVAYDDSGGATAGRLVVMLRSIGHSAALLDGGLRAWPEVLASGDAGGHHSPSASKATAQFTARAWPADRFATADEVAAAVARGAGAPVVLDARSSDRFRGDSEPIDPRQGHIPGARNAPWAANVHPDTGRFREPSALRAHYEALGVDAATGAICYCGSGVSACADVLGIELAGLGVPRLFVASWSGWSSDPARPAAVGDA